MQCYDPREYHNKYVGLILISRVTGHVGTRSEFESAVIELNGQVAPTRPTA